MGLACSAQAFYRFYGTLVASPLPPADSRSLKKNKQTKKNVVDSVNVPTIICIIDLPRCWKKYFLKKKMDSNFKLKVEISSANGYVRWI